MANADQILTLIRSHIDKDENLFLKIALQISAVEAKAGHAVLARSIQDLVNQKKTPRFATLPKPLHRLFRLSSLSQFMNRPLYRI